MTFYLTVLHSRTLFKSSTNQYLLANFVVGVVAVIASVDKVVCFVVTVVSIGAVEENEIEPLSQS